MQGGVNKHLCGIYYVRKDDKDPGWLPVVSLCAHTTICQNSSRLVLKQEFVNPGRKAIDEAAYSFPIYEGAAVVAFTCRIQDRIIRGVIREKSKAKSIYEMEKEKGQQAALMLPNQPDVWTTRISNIPAGGIVEVEITNVSELKHDSQADGIRFVLPTNIAPRFRQQPGTLAPSITSRRLSLTVAVTMISPIKSLQSPSHPITVKMGSHIPNGSPPSNEAVDFCKGFVTLSQRDTVLDTDFVVIVVSGDIGIPQAIVETHPELPNSQRALLLSVVPKFDMPKIRPEIIFIADRSGSMSFKMDQLRRALKVLLKSLPVGVKFNLCSFGTRHDFLWPKSKPYDQDSLDFALKHVEKFEANYGGSEIFSPVEEALKMRCKDLETEIIVFTDGQIWQMKPVLDMVQKECESGDVRVFSVGIGDFVSHAVVEGLARAGKGYAHIVGTEDNLDAKLVRMLKAAVGEHVSNYKLVFPASTKNSIEKDKDGFEFVEHEKSPDAMETNPPPKRAISPYDTSSDKTPADEPAAPEERFVHLGTFEPPLKLPSPYHIPPPFPFRRTNIYVLLSGAEATPQSITLQGTTTSGIRLELEVPVADAGMGTTVHQLAARKLLQELEEGGSYLHSGQFGVDPVKDEGKFADWVEREGIRLGTTFGVAGKWTSFVALENVEEFELEMGGFRNRSRAVPSSLRCQPNMRTLGPTSPAVGQLLSPQIASSQISALSSQTTSNVTAQNWRASPGHALVELCRRLVRGRVSAEAHSASSDEDSSAREGRQEERRTYALLNMQSFDGSFQVGSGDWAAQLSRAFETWMQEEVEQEVLNKLRARGKKVLPKLIASSMAVAIFEGELNGCKEIWEMVAEKTDAWGVETVGESAWKAVKLWARQKLALADEQQKPSLWMK